MKLKVALALLVFLLFLIGFWLLYEQLKIDDCLDNGGRWNRQQASCEYP